MISWARAGLARRAFRCDERTCKKGAGEFRHPERPFEHVSALTSRAVGFLSSIFEVGRVYKKPKVPSCRLDVGVRNGVADEPAQKVNCVLSRAARLDVRDAGDELAVPRASVAWRGGSALVHDAAATEHEVCRGRVPGFAHVDDSAWTDAGERAREMTWPSSRGQLC